MSGAEGREARWRVLILLLGRSLKNKRRKSRQGPKSCQPKIVKKILNFLFESNFKHAETLQKHKLDIESTFYSDSLLTFAHSFHHLHSHVHAYIYVNIYVYIDVYICKIFF